MQLTSKVLEERLARVRTLESRFTYRLAVLSKKLDLQVTEMLKDTPLTLTAYNIMMIVETFEIVSLSDISRVNVMDRAQVSRAARFLEKKGLVSFAADPNSKRKKMVRLTDAGQALLDELLPRFEARRAALEARLGPDAFSALWIGMDRLNEVIDD